MRVVHSILKYTPAVLLTLLVMAWVFTQAGYLQFVSRKFVVALQHGSVTGYWEESNRTSFFWKFRNERLLRGAPKLGQLKSADPRGSTGSWFPLPLLCTIILPLAIGPFISFRFRLWQYFAYTALVAIELAYYLWWQT
jgi:hypothetical protein